MIAIGSDHGGFELKNILIDYLKENKDANKIPDKCVKALDKYLDDALLANVPFVRIIHGVGTGALRNAVWDKLKRCRFVKSYQHGTAQEGSTGATIVYFKEKNNA